MNAISPEPHAPDHQFDTVYNFRDFGGYATPTGTVRSGLLYRSAHYGEATETDLAAFARLKMAAILDLRRPAERIRYPNRRAPGCTAESLTYGIESIDDDPPHLSFLIEDNVTVPLVHQRMTEVYRTFADDPGHIEVYAKGFDALARLDGPLVVHCHAGKDRTGLFVSGALAWWFWGLVHIFFLIDFRNRISVSLDWLWSYLTFGRAARLIMDSDRLTAPPG